MFIQHISSIVVLNLVIYIHLVKLLLLITRIYGFFMLQLFLFFLVYFLGISLHCLTGSIFKLSEPFSLLCFDSFMTIKNRICAWQSLFNFSYHFILVFFHVFHVFRLFDIIKKLILDNPPFFLFLLVINILN